MSIGTTTWWGPNGPVSLARVEPAPTRRISKEDFRQLVLGNCATLFGLGLNTVEIAEKLSESHKMKISEADVCRALAEQREGRRNG